MKIELDLKTILGILAIIGVIVSATLTIWTTFETKENHQKLDAEFTQHIHYHMQLNKGARPIFDGPIFPEEEEEPQ